jgi:hypothetical protein
VVSPGIKLSGFDLQYRAKRMDMCEQFERVEKEHEIRCCSCLLHPKYMNKGF